MRKVSTEFVVCFAALTFAGASWAQAPSSDPLAGALMNSVSSSAASLGAQPKSTAVLNAAPSSDLGSIANALNESPSARIASLKEAGVAGGENVASVKLGKSGGPSSGSVGGNVFTNALSSASLSNALSESGLNSGGASGAAEMKAATMLGIGSTSLSNALGDNRTIATQRIGGN